MISDKYSELVMYLFSQLLILGGSQTDWIAVIVNRIGATERFYQGEQTMQREKVRYRAKAHT